MNESEETNEMWYNWRPDPNPSDVAIFLTVSIAILSFGINYTTLMEVTESFGVKGWRIYAYPVLIDIAMVVMHYVWFDLEIKNVKSNIVKFMMIATVALSCALTLANSHQSFIYPVDFISFVGNFWPLLGLILFVAPPLILLGCTKAIIVMAQAKLNSKDSATPELDELNKVIAGLTKSLQGETAKAQQLESDLVELSKAKSKLGQSEMNIAHLKKELIIATARYEDWQGLFSDVGKDREKAARLLFPTAGQKELATICDLSEGYISQLSNKNGNKK